MPVEPIDCGSFNSGVDGLDPAAPLPAPLAAHLESCPRCRERLAADPSRLFALLRGRSPDPPPSWEEVRAALPARPAARGGARLAPWTWAAASAAALALGLGLWLGRPGRLEPELPRLESRAADPGGTPGFAGGDAVPASAPPTLESIVSPAARVVEFKFFGRQDQVTEVILIFDEGIEL